jgi:hypothetical protein
MCFGYLAKLVVKSYMFRCESIGKVPPKDSNLSSTSSDGLRSFLFSVGP